MRRLATISAIAIVLVFSAGGIALATGNGGGGNNGGNNPNQPSNPPCDSDSHEVKLPMGLMDKCVNGEFVHLCPDSSPNAGATPPNCGNGVGGTGIHACPENSPNPDGIPPNCGNGNGGGDDDNGGGTPPPEGGGATTCSTGGLADGTGFPGLTDPGTLINSDKNEAGPLSKPLHEQLEPAVDGLAPVVHEGNCDVVVTIGA